MVLVSSIFPRRVHMWGQQPDAHMMWISWQNRQFKGGRKHAFQWWEGTPQMKGERVLLSQVQQRYVKQTCDAFVCSLCSDKCPEGGINKAAVPPPSPRRERWVELRICTTNRTQEQYTAQLLLFPFPSVLSLSIHCPCLCNRNFYVTYK